MMLRKFFILLLPALMIISTMYIPAFSQSSSSKKWTLMIYLDADNNLEEAGIDDFNEMEVVGSTAGVDVVVQFDRIDEYDTSNGDWKGAKRYYVTKDEDTENINSIELEDIGEVNMGAPETLIDFVLFAIEKYPAEHYLLDFWDHGGGWRGVCWDDTNNNDSLTLPELEYALSAIRNRANKNIDIVLFDACNMGSVEVAYQLRKYVDICIGSEASVPGDGCPYDKILQTLTSSPETAPNALAEEIVNHYIGSYSDNQGDPDDTNAVTMAAFDLKKLDSLAENTDRLSMCLSKKTGHYLYNGEVCWCRKNAQTFSVTFVPSPFPNIFMANIDLYDFASEISTQFGIDQKAKDAAIDVMDVLDSAKIAEAHGSAYPNAHGLTIYFPNDIPTLNEYNEKYAETDFAVEKYWDAFVENVYDRDSASDTPPTCLITVPERCESISNENYIIKGSAFDVESLQAVEIKIDDGEWQTVEGSGEWSYNWQPSSGKHKIYARSFDGAQYSTEFEVDIEVPAKRGEAAPTTFWILIGIAVALAAFVFLLAIKKVGKKGLSGKLLAH